MLSHWTGTLGGAELQVRYLMDYCRKNTDHELSMICRHTKLSEEDGVPIYRSSSIWPLGRYFKAADYFSIRKLLRRIEPDVIYTRVSSPYVGFAAQYCRAHGKKLVYHIAHIDDVTPMSLQSIRRIPKKMERPLFEYGLRSANIIIAQANYQVKLLQQHYDRTVSDVIPNFHPAPDRVSKSGHGRTVVWVANIKPAKRPELFVKLAERCANLKRTKFIMVGALQDRRYETLLDDASKIPNLEFLGQRSVEEVNDLLEQASLFVNTSRVSGEGFPNTFIQAWLRATPVVSLEVNPDGLLDSSRFGICAQGSLDRLVETTAGLLGDSEHLRQLGERSRETAIADYSLDNCARIVDLIQETPPLC